MSEHETVLEHVRRALGRGGSRLAEAATPVPVPPALPDHIVRLVGTDAKLPELFAQRAAELKMHVTPTPSAQVAQAIVTYLRQYPIKRIALPVSPLLERLNIAAALRAAGFEVRRWDEMTLDELYDFDCAVTDVTCAVAETGTLVIKPSAGHGRGLSLVPMYHVAVVETNQLLPDLVDLFERLSHDPDHSNVILISGPSKTADIEMNVVTGVHGPNVVQVFLTE